MKRTALFFIVVVSLQPLFAHTPADWMYLVSKEQFGAITKATTYKDLIDLFGKDKLKDETHAGPEGEGEVRCTVVYKGTSQEITVFWAEKSWHKTLSSVACTRRDSPYHTEQDLKTGSSLNELVKANKADITFYGFGWDFGGTITGYHNGNLQNKGVNFTLNWNSRTGTALLGDAEFTSKTPAVIKQAKQIYVARMQVSFL